MNAAVYSMVYMFQAFLIASALSGVCAQAPATPAAAGLHGAITTQNGAVYLPGVVITVVDPATDAAVTETTSDATGQYRIANLKPGTYTVRAVLNGFSNAVTPSVQAAAGRDIELNLDLAIAKLAAHVNVQAGRREIPLEASQTMTTANGVSLEIGPIKGDNFEALLPVLPGVMRGPD